MADQLFKYSFTLKTKTGEGNKMRMDGDVYDVDGHPSSAFDKVRETCAKSIGPPELYTHADIVLSKSVKPIRRIKIIREPTGLEGVEACFFCKQPTRYWNKKRNLPVCDTCATTHTPDELPNPVVKK
jgi:hypothetical protein